MPMRGSITKTQCPETIAFIGCDGLPINCRHRTVGYFELGAWGYGVSRKRVTAMYTGNILPL